jgi:hypothetical protein
MKLIVGETVWSGFFLHLALLNARVKWLKEILNYKSRELRFSRSRFGLVVKRLSCKQKIASSILASGK